MSPPPCEQISLRRRAPAERWVLVTVEEAYIHCSAHPHMEKVEEDVRHWDDDVQPKAVTIFRPNLRPGGDDDHPIDQQGRPRARRSALLRVGCRLLMEAADGERSGVKGVADAPANLGGICRQGATLPR